MMNFNGRFLKSGCVLFALAVLALLGSTLAGPALAVEPDANRIQNYAHPDWVHPLVRPVYAGYEKLLDAKKEKKEEGKWPQNMPGGKIRGGGTTEYWDYKPFYMPPYYRVPRYPAN